MATMSIADPDAQALRERLLELEEKLANRDKTIAEEKARLTKALDELRLTQAKLLHGQKLQAIGQLAAGIAHEVNTPAQYVTDNVSFLQRAFDKLWRVLDAQSNALTAATRSRRLATATSPRNHSS
jgi:two-component system, NtrC family, sensor kinase